MKALLLPALAAFAAMLLSGAALNAQVSHADSALIRRFMDMPDSHAKVDSLFRTASRLRRSIDTEPLLVEALRVAEETGYTEMQYMALDYYGVYMRDRSRYSEALDMHSRALEMAAAHSDTMAQIVAYNNLGVLYRRLDEFNYALDNHFKSLKLSEQLNNTYNISIALNSLGNVHISLGNYREAISYFERCLPIAEESGNSLGLAINLNNIGEAYEYLNMLDSAEYYYNASLQQNRKINSARGEAISYSALGKVLYRHGRTDEAIDLFAKALEINLQLSDHIYVANNRISMGFALVEKRQYRLAEDHLREGLKTALEIGSKTEVREAYRGLARMFEARKRFEEAFRYERLYRSYADSIANENNSRLMAHMEAIYAAEKKDMEIQRQKAEIGRHEARQRLYAGGLAMAILLLALLALIIRLRSLRNRELVETNATKDRFFSIISHDLKNPAVAQRDALQLLVDNAGDWDAATLLRYYGVLLKSADGQVELLYNLLNWAQVQTGRMPYRPVLFDIVSALNSDITLIRSMAERKGVTVSAVMPSIAMVTGDSNMLAAVVRNLLVNAVKFTSGGGAVLLEIALCSNGSCTVSVSDTGTGMSEEQVRSLFRIDSRQSRKGTAGEQGSGLGLVVCRELLEKHGCGLHVESAEGKGTRFWFVLRST
ncbi:MAG: tetratricopeptide repeat-containing sensor histidine kinase [Bacteroidales bacterium]|jgi:signal transduction histidine kinase|nr:tetratricopeptide repeat-containing sensor histidine kinase [Bacteroidales bacterium]